MGVEDEGVCGGGGRRRTGSWEGEPIKEEDGGERVLGRESMCMGRGGGTCGSTGWRK